MDTTTTTPAGTVAAAPSTPGPSSGSRSAWRAGARDMLPVLVGMVPFGLAVGHAVDEAVGPEATVVSSLLVFAGAAQLTLAEMLESGAPRWRRSAAVVLVNARLVLFGGAVGAAVEGRVGRVPCAGLVPAHRPGVRAGNGAGRAARHPAGDDGPTTWAPGSRCGSPGRWSRRRRC